MDFSRKRSKGEGMKNFIKWLGLNISVQAILIAGYYFGETGIPGFVVGGYTLISIIMLLLIKLAVMFKDKMSAGTWNKFAETVNGKKLTINRLLDVGCIYLTFYMGYNKVGIFMIIELILSLSIVLSEPLELKDEMSGPLLTKTAYDNDLLMIYANNDPSVCQLLPPLVMETEKINEIAQQLDKALTAARRLKPVVSVKSQLGNLWDKR